jgi:acyl carrier protein
VTTNYLAKIKKIISEKTGLDVSEITEESYFEEDLNISEMELMEILSEVEEVLHVDLSEEKDEIETVGDLIDILIEKLE